MGAYRGRAPNFLGVIRHSFRGGPPEIPSARERHILASEGRAIAEVACARWELTGKNNISSFASNSLTGRDVALRLFGAKMHFSSERRDATHGVTSPLLKTIQTCQEAWRVWPYPVLPCKL
jgi:hypothetical protein